MLMYRSEMVNRDELRQISPRQIINKVIKVKQRENLKNKMMVYIERNDKIALTFHQNIWNSKFFKHFESAEEFYIQNSYQARILYLEQLSFKNEGKIKTFLN